MKELIEAVLLLALVGVLGLTIAVGIGMVVGMLDPDERVERHPRDGFDGQDWP